NPKLFSSVTVLQKHIHAVVDSASRTYKVGLPSQIVNADQEAPAGGDPVGDIEGPVSGPPGRWDVPIERIVGSEARMKRVVPRRLHTEFRPTASTSYLGSG